MKVKCVSLSDPLTGDDVESNGWLRLGEVYHVLSVYISTDRKVDYRLIPHTEPTPALFSADHFEIASGALPPNWIIACSDEGYFELTPKLWSVPGFWERYFNFEQAALDDFENERRAILQSDP